MTLNKILKSVVRENLPNPGSGMFNAITSSSPMPTLLKPILGWSTILRSRMQGYDAMALAMSNVPSAVEAIAEDQDKLDSEISSTCFITEEEASILFSGIAQAREVLAPNDPLLALTSSSGLVYNIQVNSNRIECITADLKAVPVVYYDEVQQQWVLLKKWPSTLEVAPSTVQNHFDLLSILQRCCNYLTINPTSGNIQTMMSQVVSHYETYLAANTLVEMTRVLCNHFEIQEGENVQASWIALEPLIKVSSIPGRVINGASESFISLMSSCVDTGTINGLFLECIDAIKSTKIESWIALQQQYGNEGKRDCIKKIMHRIALSYHQGGLKGVIYYLYQVIKGQSSIKDDNGVLVFTDNSALLPREYIAGLIGQVISAIVTVVGAIVAMVFQIVGIIISVIGTIAWSLFGSLKQDISDTRASLPEFSIDDKSVNLIQYTPNSMLRGEIDVDTWQHHLAWYKDFYANSGSCAVMDVPGGALFLGPGSFNEDGSIHTVRFEFHALSAVLLRWKCGLYFQDKVRIVNNAVFGLYSRHPNDIWESWVNLIKSDPFVTVHNDASSGHLSEEDDENQYGSIAFCTLVFLYWFAMEENPYLPRDNDHVLTVFGPDLDSFALWPGTVYMWVDSPDTLTAAWTDLVDLSTKMSGSDPVKVFGWWEHSGDDWAQTNIVTVLPTSTNITASLNHLANEKYPASVYHYYNLNVGTPLPLPDTPEYGINLPRFNANTFWIWMTLAGVVTTAVAVTTVVCAVKFSKWSKRKRIENVAKFTDAQSTYQDAMSGVRTEVDPETGEIVQKHFDVNSPEGQAYIKSCYKSYRKTAFTNNIMANVIGGTRYDATTLFGEAEESDDSSSDESILSSVSELEDETLYGTDEQGSETALNSASLQSVDLAPVLQLIKG